MSQIKGEGFLNLEKAIFRFWLKTIRDSKVRAAKYHGKKFRSKLAAPLSGIGGFHWTQVSSG